ncbi:phosphatidate cytidylyltransferase [Mycoemilia scoparia]|uniref:Phosphatidate cytidylyltransferase n=1 Tax=Mycoemilia scoparia TaxID=417184 RepID=A0A9W8AAJ0_9FUNG|nr:phosphatidate cytidylyltransferase [Mycoemilia scoparia]
MARNSGKSGNQSPVKPKGNSSTLRQRKVNKGNTVTNKDLVGEDHSSVGKKRWETVRKRTVFTLLMIGGFFMVLAGGPVPIMIMVFGLQLAIYKELIGLASEKNKERDLPWQRALNWYFLLTTEYYLYGHIFNRYMAKVPILGRYAPLMTSHHKFISFTVYLIGFVWFVATLQKGFYRFQFGHFAWTHMALLLVIFQTHFMVENIFAGIFWFFIPIALVIVNDIFAYIFGFFFGRHSLISLSPKKTWEGYIGGGLATLAFGFLLTSLLSRWNYVICPIEHLRTNALHHSQCTPNPIFAHQDYELPYWLSMRREILKLSIRPVQIHSLALSAFASLIAPFGGFFASGVKRAFNIKDFGNSIPGHGGVSDRFDCQIFMATFSHIYYTTFIEASPITIAKVLETIVNGLTIEDQVVLFLKLKDHLMTQEVLEEGVAKAIETLVGS